MQTAQHEQRMEALALANAIRCENAKMRRHLRTLRLPEGCEFVVEILRSDLKGPEGGIMLGRLLNTIRGLGGVRVMRAYRAAEVVDPTRAVRRLTPRQRALLADHLVGVAAVARSRQRV